MSFKEDLMNWLSGYKENEEINPQPKEEEPKPKEEEPKKELDSKDLLIKSLQDEILGYKNTISSKDEIINQNNEQIKALKDLTSKNNPIEPQLTLQEIIEKGEF